MKNVSISSEHQAAICSAQSKQLGASLLKPENPSVRQIHMLIGAAQIVVFALLCWQAVALSAPLSGDISNPRFSSDGQRIAFDLCDPRCTIAVFDRKANLVTTYLAPDNMRVLNPSFDPNGKRLIFVIEEPAGRAVRSNIASADLDGKDLRIHTDSNLIKRYPSMSRDGIRIVFVGGSPLRTEPNQLSKDIFIVSGDGEVTRQLTKLDLLTVSAPRYTKDEGLVVFSGDVSRLIATHRGLSLPETNMGKASLGWSKALFVVSPLTGDLQLRQVALEEIRSPVAIPGGGIVLVARVNEMDRIKGPFVHDLFLIENAAPKRLTEHRRFIRGFDVTDAGMQIAIVSAPNGYGKKFDLHVLDLTSGKLEQASPANRLRVALQRSSGAVSR